jgi:hypothetical protein
VIPRIGKRADNILLLGDQVLVLEFKVGADVYDSAAERQVTGYALDLKNFHLGSQGLDVTPILVATRAHPIAAEPSGPYEGVYPVVLANTESLTSL